MTPAVLILAGSRPGAPDPVAAAEGTAHKALALVEGETLLARVAGAARAFGAASIIVSSNQPAVVEEARRLSLDVLPAAGGPSQSVAEAFDKVGAPLIVTTADHPLLEAGWLYELVERTPRDADVSLMLARRDLVEQAAPASTRTWIKLADGHWSGCNLFYMARPAARLAAQAWREVEADRKRPWRIARKLGLAPLVDYALGRLTMERAIARLGQRIGIKAALVAAPDGKAAIDVDRPADLALVRALAAQPRG